jgi:hypothetical protein
MDDDVDNRESSLERIRARLYSNQPVQPLVPPPLSSQVPQPVWGETPESYGVQAPQTQSRAQTPEEHAYSQYGTWTPDGQHVEEAPVEPVSPLPPAAAATQYATNPQYAIAPKVHKKRFSWTVLFLGMSIIFFLIAGGISLLFLLRGGLSVSNNNLIITITGPTTIASGSTVPLTITVQNNNPAAITNADISIAYPDGTRSPDDVTEPLVRYANRLGTIPAGKSVTSNVSAVLFGTINQSVSIPVTIQYNTANSNAVFTKQQNYVSTVTSSPLAITSQSISNVASGQPFTIALTVRSSATDALSNIAVNAAYPAGFSVQSVSLAGGAATNTTAKGGTKNQSLSTTNPLYALGTLLPGDQRTITITGSLSGTDKDQKDFEFTVGTAGTNGAQGLAVAYASQTNTVTVSPPFLSATLSLNHGDTDPTVVTPGEAVSGLVTWMNTLTTSLTNAQVSLVLSGNALNPSSVTTTNGYYDSSTNTIVFTPQTESSLALLNPGDTGNGQFTLSTKTGSALSTLRNPVIQIAVTVTGQPTGQNPETISHTLTSTIQVATDLELISQIVHSSGPFKNSGPVPPSPNQPTTYTVELAVANSVNSVGGAVATMILPQYVEYTGEVTPSDGSVTYDASSRTVTWKIGDVPAGTGSATKALAAAFQISYIPSVSQSGTSPILIGNQTLTGTDRFTNAQVGNTAQALTTQTTGDAGYNPAFGTVGN